MAEVDGKLIKCLKNFKYWFKITRDLHEQMACNDRINVRKKLFPYNKDNRELYDCMHLFPNEFNQHERRFEKKLNNIYKDEITVSSHPFNYYFVRGVSIQIEFANN